jgi:hypothetical protein
MASSYRWQEKTASIIAILIFWFDSWISNIFVLYGTFWWWFASLLHGQGYNSLVFVKYK